MTRVEFQLTEDDYAEVAFGRASAAQRYAGAILLAALALYMAAPAALHVLVPQPRSAALTGLVKISRATAPGATPGARAVHLAGTVAPVAAWTVAVFVPLLVAGVGPVAAPWRPPPNKSRRNKLTSWLLGGLLAVAIPSPFVSAMGRTWYETALVMAPLALVLGAWAVLSAVQQAAVVRRQWQAQRQLHRPTTFELSPDGGRLVWADRLVRHEYAWEAVVGYRETPGLLLLYLSPALYLIVAKRGFADPAELGRFRMTLAERVSEGTLLPAAEGFAVLPAGGPGS